MRATVDVSKNNSIKVDSLNNTGVASYGALEHVPTQLPTILF